MSPENMIELVPTFLLTGIASVYAVYILLLKLGVVKDVQTQTLMRMEGVQMEIAGALTRISNSDQTQNEILSNIVDRLKRIDDHTTQLHLSHHTGAAVAPDGTYTWRSNKAHVQFMEEMRSMIRLSEESHSKKTTQILLVMERQTLIMEAIPKVLDIAKGIERDTELIPSMKTEQAVLKETIKSHSCKAAQQHG